MSMRPRPEDSEIESIITLVENQSSDREYGCLSLRAERLLVANCAALREALKAQIDVNKPLMRDAGSDLEQARYWKGAFDRMAAKNQELVAACEAALSDANQGYPSDGHTINLLTQALRFYS